MQIGNQRIHFRFPFEFLGRSGNLLVGVWDTYLAQRTHVRRNAKAFALTQELGCTGCHNMDGKLVGPGFTDVAKKYAGKTDYLEGKIKAGGSGVWGETPMPPQNIPDADLKTIAEWLAAGAGK